MAATNVVLVERPVMPLVKTYVTQLNLSLCEGQAFSKTPAVPSRMLPTNLGVVGCKGFTHTLHHMQHISQHALQGRQ